RGGGQALQESTWAAGFRSDRSCGPGEDTCRRRGIERTQRQLRRRWPHRDGTRHSTADRPHYVQSSRNQRRQLGAGPVRLVGEGFAMRQPVVIAGLAVLAAAALLGGLIAAAQYLRGWVKEEPRYRIPFADIDCAAPPGLSREAFLSEVRFVAEFDDE